MALIELHADLKQTNRLLERLAKALEVIVLREYGVYIGHTAEPAHDPAPNAQPTVGYATDADSTKAALIEMMQIAKEPESPAELEHDDWSRA